MTMRFGAQLWSQHDDLARVPRRRRSPPRRPAGTPIWTWDHLLAIFGPWEQPIFEGWSLLAAVGAVTSGSGSG